MRHLIRHGRLLLAAGLVAALSSTAAQAGIRCFDLPKNMVIAVQETLHSEGFAPGPIDGDLGPRTARAVADFQRREGLKVTYDLNGATLRELFGSGFDPEDHSLQPNPQLPPDLFDRECR